MIFQMEQDPLAAATKNARVRGMRVGKEAKWEFRQKCLCVELLWWQQRPHRSESAYIPKVGTQQLRNGREGRSL